jgi:hypothetical protein
VNTGFIGAPRPHTKHQFKHIVHSFDFNRHASLLPQKRSSYSVQDTAETAVLSSAPSSGSCIFFNVALGAKETSASNDGTIGPKHVRRFGFNY